MADVQTRYEWRCDNNHMHEELLDGDQMEADVPAPPCPCGASVYFWSATLLDDARREFEDRVATVQTLAREALERGPANG